MSRKTVRARTVGTLLVMTAVALGACSSPSTGPSPVATAPSTAAAAGQRPAVVWPASLDAAYVRALTGNHPLERWAAGAALRHCAGPGVDPAVVAAAADLITRVAGLAQRSDGPCSVLWDSDPTPGHTLTFLTVTPDHEITGARVAFRGSDGVSGFSAGHEAGHVLGLEHSPRPEDLMFQTSRGGFDFSPDELAVLAAMYPR